MDYDRIMQLLQALEREKVEYILVGGVAINLHGVVRATQDVDLFVRPEKENIQRLKRALRSLWNDPEIDSISHEDLAGDYPTVRYGPPDDDFIIDLMARLGDAFRYEDLAAENLTWKGGNVRIATPQTLYEMKKDTLRWQDRADAEALRERFQIEER
jgi:predicted nucleotidyltransferase